MGKQIDCNSSSNAVYGLGFIGAAIYYIAAATSFWVGVLGILKAIVWPAFRSLIIQSSKTILLLHLYLSGTGYFYGAQRTSIALDSNDIFYDYW